MRLAKQILLFSCFLLTGFSLMSRELVINGDFNRNENGVFPPFWMVLNEGGSRVDYFSQGGPDNRPFLRLTSGNRDLHVQQNQLKLVPGGKYRLSGWFRTRNVLDKESGICVGASSFPKHERNILRNLPANLPEWRHYEQDIVISSQVDPIYTYYVVDIGLGKGDCTMDVTGISLKPLSAKTETESLSQIENMTPCLVPVGNLFYLSSKAPVMDFFWVGKFPGDSKNAECEFFFSKDNKVKRVPFSCKRFAVDFKGVLNSHEEQSMRIRILSRKDGKVLFEETYPIRMVDIPVLPSTARSLNNLVTELYNGEFISGQKLEIPNPRRGFLLFRFLPDKKGEKFTVTLNGKSLFDQDAMLSETIRMLEPGIYPLAVTGAKKGRLIVRMIPEIMTFALWGPRLPENGPYDWNWGMKHIFPGLTTLNIGPIREKEFAAIEKMGRLYLENYGIQNWSKINDPEDFLDRMNKDRVMSNPLNHGTTLDENECWYPTMLDPYAYALKHFKNPHDKLLVTYQTGFSPSFLNVLSAEANASKGKGWLAFEVYPRGQKTERDLQNMLDMVAQNWNIIRDNAPGLFPQCGVIWGNFSAPPGISLAHDPAVDYKVVLDCKMHLLANHPTFKGLGKTGWWGTYACDEEMARWSFRLMRHYAFEGKKDLLSKKFGFTLRPGHVVNGDFENGLQGWACKGTVSVDKAIDYGYKSLMLHGNKGTGDTYALFQKADDGISSLRQTAKGFIPGKKYLFTCYVGDLDDVIQKRDNPRKLPLAVTLKNARILKHTHFDGRGSKTREGNASINIHRIIFVAEEKEINLLFDNAAATPGQNLMLNFVSIRPYYEEERNW